jgi:hypothetical protein
MLISGSRPAAAVTPPLFFPPPTRILEISDADTLHDRDRYSMGSSGVCGGGIAATASSSSSSPTTLKATSLAFQLFSIAIYPTSCCSCTPLVSSQVTA